MAKGGHSFTHQKAQTIAWTICNLYQYPDQLPDVNWKQFQPRLMTKLSPLHIRSQSNKLRYMSMHGQGDDKRLSCGIDVNRRHAGSVSKLAHPQAHALGALESAF